MSFLGHTEQQLFLQSLLQSHKRGHAYAFTGPKGIGKAHIAQRFAFACFAENIELKDPYGPLWARMQGGGHGNYRYVERTYAETGKLSRDISVDVVRGLMDFFSQSAFEPGWRVVIIDSADDLSRQSANSLLKILEEPPAQSLFILINHSPGKLLPTLRSRVQLVPFYPLHVSDMSALCKIQGWNSQLIPLAEGSPGLLQKWSTFITPTLVKNFEDLLAHLTDKGQGVISFIESLIASSEGQEDFLESFALFVQAWLGHQIHYKIAQKPCHPLYQSVSLNCMAEKASSIHRLCQETQSAYLDQKQTLAVIMCSLGV